MPNLTQLLALLVALGFTTPEPEPMNDAELSSAVAAIITGNGHLCAQVVDLRQIEHGERYEVTCLAHAGDTVTVRYIMNTRDGTAVKA